MFFLGNWGEGGARRGFLWTETGFAEVKIRGLGRGGGSFLLDFIRRGK